MAPPPFRGDITRDYGRRRSSRWNPGRTGRRAVGPYRAPFPFTGTLEKLELRSGPLPQLSESQQKLEEQYAERIAASKD